MGSRVFTGRSVAIAVCIVLVAGLIGVVVCLLLGLGPLVPRLALVGGGTFSVDETSVEYLLSDRGIALAMWCARTEGPSGSSSESGLFSTTASGFFTSADGKQIKWEWNHPRDKGGDFKIDGTAYDLANGTLFLMSIKAGKLEVTQLDVDLSQVQANAHGFHALAKMEPKIARFFAEAAGNK